MGESTLRSESEQETILLGEQIAAQFQPGDVITLEGDLGAGKTEFVKGVCRYFDVTDMVTSPTFSIINQYDGTMAGGEPVKIYHVDLYRIDSPSELAEVGFDDMVFTPNAIKLIEWPEKAAQHMPERHWKISIEQDEANDDVRLITVHEPVTHEHA
jgi:tRNA threonylcarbamoyladenosine biosynthesis protein TsaE